MAHDVFFHLCMQTAEAELKLSAVRMSSHGGACIHVHDSSFSFIFALHAPMPATFQRCVMTMRCLSLWLACLHKQPL